MIQAMIFDLDGTLLQTEKLKARSYAQAVIELCPNTVAEDEVLESFKDVVGRSRREVALALMEQYKLEERTRSRMAEFGVSEPWQAFVQVRLTYYEKMIADANVLRENQWAHNMDLLYVARQRNCAVALATMSHRETVMHILDVLNLHDQFDFVATRDDVENGKPDPEIYLLVAEQIGVPPASCLVIEDSPSGVQAALNAGMKVIAVSTPFTKDYLRHVAGLEHIIDEPDQLLDVVRQYEPRV